METAETLVDVLENSDAVHDYGIQENSNIRFWTGTRTYEKSEQEVLERIGALDRVDLIDEGVKNDWHWYSASTLDSIEPNRQPF